MSASQRRKGAAGEREWAEVLRGHGYPDAKRNLSQTRDSGTDVPAPPILWEVKRHAAFSVYKHVEQAQAALPQHLNCDTAAAAIRGDGKEWLVVIRAEDFFRNQRTRQ